MHYERARRLRRSKLDVAATAAGWSAPVPGRELHPLESSAFSRRTFSTTISSREKRLLRFLSWSAIGAALNSKNTARTLIGKAALELSWFGEVEGPFPAIWSSGFPTRSLWITPMVEWKSSSVLGVVATSESGTHRDQLIVPFVSFVGEKQPTSIAIGWSEPVPGREMHPLSPAPCSTALFFKNCLSNRYNFIEYPGPLMVAPS
jgi:hypothetical protein